jgi:hypothetical protein
MVPAKYPQQRLTLTEFMDLRIYVFHEPALHFFSPDYENLQILCSIGQLSEFLTSGNELPSLPAVANDSV